MSEPTTVKSLARALTILDALVFDTPDDGLALAELARRVEMPRNTCHKVLQTFVGAGYVRTDGTGRYAIGPRCVEIGRRAVLTTAAVRRTVDDHLRTLAGELSEGVIYTVLVDGRRRPLARAEPNRAVRVDSGILDRHGIYALPTGRVLLAYASPSEVDRIVERHGLPGADWDGIASREALDAAAARFRHDGVAFTDSGEDGLYSVAVPVLETDETADGSAGRLLGALGCYAPGYRCPPAARPTLTAALRTGADRLARRLATAATDPVPAFVGTP